MSILFALSYFIEYNIGYLSHELAINVASQIKKFIYSLGVLAAAVFLIKGLNFLVFDLILKKQMNISIPKLLIQLLNTFVIIIFIIMILNGIYKVPLTGLLAASSAIGVSIAFGMKDILSDIFSGIALNIEKPFKINDSIELSSGLRGVVHDISWRSTSLRTVYDTMISVPNSQINAMEIINFNKPNKLYKLSDEFYLNYSVPTNQVRRIVLSVLEAENIVLQSDKVSVHVRALETKGIKYQITYFCPDIFMELKIRTKILSKILKKLGESNLKPSYQNYDINYTSLKKLPLDIDKIDFLKRIDLFRILDEDSLSKISNSMKKIILPAKKYLIKEGEENDTSLYILKEGLLEVFVKEKKSQKNLLVSKVESGSYLGEFSLLTQKPRAATVKTKTDSILYEISEDDIRPILDSNAQFIQYLSDILTNREIENQNRINSFYSIDSNGKELLNQKILSKIKKVFCLHSN